MRSLFGQLLRVLLYCVIGYVLYLLGTNYTTLSQEVCFIVPTVLVVIGIFSGIPF